MSVPVTEDTPPDMLAGGMDLSVLLPDGRAGKLTVQRATPMMDLLVQLCTSYRLAPGSHVLQPLGENGPLPYKPSTPIGLLDAWSVRILPRQRSTGNLQPQNALPFQHTFRLQIHLPRNQLLVQRVSPQTVLSSVLKLACEEKNLDGNKYELRHPGNLEERLQLDLTLADYGLSEVAVVSKIDGGADILALQREQDRRRRRVKAGHLPPTQPGCIKKKSSAFDGSVSSGRSSSPDSSGVSPPQGTINVAPKVIPANAITIANQPMAPPKVPLRKRRPAPPPPQAKNESSKQDESPAVTHSRTSSDSSGYHEASVLSDGPENNQVPLRSTEVHNNSTIPRRSKLPSSSITAVNLRPQEKVNSSSLSRSMSNLTENGLNGNRVNGELSASTSSLSSGHGYRKKKAAPPPPVVSKTSSLERKVESQISNNVAKNQTLPRATSTSSISSRNSQRAPSIEEEEATLQEEHVKTKVAVHNQDLVTPAMRANLVAELNNRLPNLRNDSVSSDGSNTGSSMSSVVEEPARSKPEPIYAKVVRPSSQKKDTDLEKVVSSNQVVKQTTSSTKSQEPEMKTEIVKPPIPAPKARTIASTPVPLPRSLSSQTPKDIPEQISFDKDTKKSKLTHTRTSSETSSVSSGIYGTVGRTFGSGLTLVAMSSDTTSVSSFHSVSGVEEEDDSEPLEVKEATMFEPKLESQSEIDYEDYDEYYEEDSDAQDEFGRLGRWPASESLHDLGRDEEDFADEGIENDDMAEEVARAFASATAELEAVILAEDLKAAQNQQEKDLEIPPPLPRTPVPTSPLVDGDEWTYELPAPPSAFRDKNFSSSNSPNSSRPTSPIINVDPSSFGIVSNRKNPLFNEDEFPREAPLENGNFEVNNKMLPRQLAFEVIENECFTTQPEVHSERVVNSSNTLENVNRLKILPEMNGNHGYKRVVNENLKNGTDVEFSAGLKSHLSDVSNKHNNNNFKKSDSQENETKMCRVPNRTSEKKDDIQILKQSIKVNENMITELKKSVEEERNYNNAQQLSNFTITSYSREIDSNLIFEPEHSNGQQTAVKVARSNSFSNRQSTIPSVTKPSTTTIRRSASNVYLALQSGRDSKEEEDNEKGQIDVKVVDHNVNDTRAAPLQSLQVLRTILPQLQQNVKDTVRENCMASSVVQASQNNQDQVESFSKSVPEQVHQISRPYRPPAVNLSSWNERPKGLQVALKDDSDYRIGRGQASGSFEQSIPSKEISSVHISQVTQPKIIVPKPFINNDLTSRNNAAWNDIKTNNLYKEQKIQGNEVSSASDVDTNVHSHDNLENKIYKHQQPKYDTGALTMRIITHTTATGYRKKVVDSQPIKPAEKSIISFSQDGEVLEPRVLPVVRSVELKKCVSQPNINDVQNGHVTNGSIFPEKESFQGVSSLAQKFGGNQMVERRAFKSNNTRRPVSEYFTAGRIEKVDQSVKNNSENFMRHSESLTNLNKVQRPGMVAPTVRGFRLPSEPKKPQQPIQINPREQLMEAIRGFGGRNNLRCTEVVTQ